MTDKKPDLIATIDPTAEFEKPFWQVKRLEEMNQAEWEISLRRAVRAVA